MGNAMLSEKLPIILKSASVLLVPLPKRNEELVVEALYGVILKVTVFLEDRF